MSMLESSTPGDKQYINAIDYQDWNNKLKDLSSVMDDLTKQSVASRKLRYGMVDVEGERSSGKLQPDELYIPQHIIDSNIRREQSSYVQYVVQSPRAVILEDLNQPANDCSLLEKDLTSKIRYNGWQLSMFACIDGMQQEGYGIMELVRDQSQPGELRYEFVQKCDFGLTADTKDIQQAELIGRHYYFSKTALLNLALPPDQGGKGFDITQVNRVIENDPQTTEATAADSKDKSLYRITKVMFRVGGVVMVAWVEPNRCDNWLRVPQPCFIGRRKIITDSMTGQPMMVNGIPQSQEIPETNYPYFLFPYLISENDTISQLKGRVYLDQDTQEAASSLISSVVTAHRRAAGTYFSKDTDDPNNDVLMDKNIFFQTGALINAKVKQFQMSAPGADMLAAIQMLVTSNQAQTSQVNFAAMNRKDSRKTATEIQAASQEAQSLSTVQVVLFSNSLQQLYQVMFDVIVSRVVSGLIQVRPELLNLYRGKYAVKPSGDVDVIQRQQLVSAMMQMWPVMATTPAAMAFLSDMLVRMFPEYAPKYIQMFQQAQQMQQSQQMQMMQQGMQMMQKMGQGIINLSQHPEMFSETGMIHAYPVVKQAADGLEQMQKQMGASQQQKQIAQ